MNLSNQKGKEADSSEQNIVDDFGVCRERERPTIEKEHKAVIHLIWISNALIFLKIKWG